MSSRTRGANAAALRVVTPKVLEYIKNASGVSWGELSRRLDMEPRHLVEVRNARRHVPASRVWHFFRLIVDYRLMDEVLAIVEGAGGSLDLTEAARQQAERDKLFAIARRKGLFG